MVFGQRVNKHHSHFGQRTLNAPSLGQRHNHTKKHHHHMHNHTVEETRVVSHDQGPAFMFQIHGHGNMHNKKPVHNDLERHKPMPKNEAQPNHYV